MDGMASVLARLKAMNGTGRQMDVHQVEMIAAGDCLNKLEENEGFGKNTISSNVTYVCYAPLSQNSSSSSLTRQTLSNTSTTQNGS